MSTPEQQSIMELILRTQNNYLQAVHVVDQTLLLWVSPKMLSLLLYELGINDKKYLNGSLKVYGMKVYVREDMPENDICVMLESQVATQREKNSEFVVLPVDIEDEREQKEWVALGKKAREKAWKEERDEGSR